jgi:hypothetical protein
MAETDGQIAGPLAKQRIANLLAVAKLLLFRYDCDDIIRPEDAELARAALAKASE